MGLILTCCGDWSRNRGTIWTCSLVLWILVHVLQQDCLK